MYYLILSGTVNVILNLILVIYFKLGVAGVAIATVISNILSAGLVLIYLYRREDEFQFRPQRLHIEKEDLKKEMCIRDRQTGDRETAGSVTYMRAVSGVLRRRSTA